MLKLTWSDLDDAVIKKGWCLNVGRLMVMVEDETGIFPSWDEIAPQWALDVAKVN